MNKDVQTDEACGLTQKYRNDTSKIDHKFASSDQCISNSSNPLTSFKKSKSVD